MNISNMDNPIKLWRRDKENKNTVKITSEAGEQIGELRFSLVSTSKKSEIKDFNK